jgi:hypothetical protein
MNTRRKRALPMLALAVGLWTLAGARPQQATAADPDVTRQQNPAPTPNTQTPPPSELEDMLSTFSPAPSFAEPPEAEPRQKPHKCEMNQINLRSCEPQPGSALSAFPVVINMEQRERMTSA